MRSSLLTSKLLWESTLPKVRSFRSRRTGDERPTTLDVSSDRHAYPPLVFSRVKSYTQAAEQPLK